MGNAGDLIKHELIAEFCEWWLRNHDDVFRFVDPFAGRPYVSPPHTEVIRRIQQLAPCALKRAQRDIDHCYYGSSNIIRQVAQGRNREVQVYISDRNEKAVADFLDAGFEPIQHVSFQRSDSFSILDCQFEPGNTSLILLDPFDDFLPEYAGDLVPRLPDFIRKNDVPVALFVLYETSGSEQKNKWRELQNRYLMPGLRSLSLSCCSMVPSSVKGESRFDSEIILLFPVNHESGSMDILIKRLRNFAESLGRILDQPVIFHGNWKN